MKKIDWSKNKLWRLPDDIKKRVVKHKTPESKEHGEISKYIAVALARLDTHNEMRIIAEQIHPSTKYKPFNKAITAYKKASEETKHMVLNNEIPIMSFVKDDLSQSELSEKDKKSWIRYKNAQKLKDQLINFYRYLKFFLDGDEEDREYLKKQLKAKKIHYIASLLSCIRNEELLQSFKQHQGIKSLEEFKEG